MKKALFMWIAIMITLALLLGACAQPAPTPAPAPAPAPKPAPAPAPTPKPAPAPAPKPAPAPAPKPAPAPPTKPEVFVWGTFGIGSGVYIQSAFIAEAVQEKFGIKTRLVPLDTGVARIMATKSGFCDINGLGATDIWAARNGLYDFAVLEWGPQTFQMIYQANRKSIYSPAVRADSDIMTAADLKGKKCARVEGAPAQTLRMESGLAFAGLTWDDVEPVTFASYGASCKALIAGQVDAVPYSSVASFAYELESSPQGIRWLPFPADDTEGWKRIKAVEPVAFPTLCEFGAGLSKENPVWTINHANPTFVGYDTLDEDLVYWQVKAIAESQPLFEDKHVSGPWWHVDESLKCEVIAPYHPGAVKYFKEQGKWTSELEAKQQEILEHDMEVKELWDKTVILAVEQGIEAKEYPDFWVGKWEAFQKQWREEHQ
ncbi:TAXI family TRAP transporter solute-binding subunit [Chloroflexota bacterium]